MVKRGPRTTFVKVADVARGGMGKVELVLRRDGRFRRLYALKRIHPLLLEEDRVRTMLLEEARVAGLLRHPNTVGVLDVGEDDEGPFLIMDYVDGITLAELISSVANNENLLPLDICLNVIRQTAEGLHAAHELADHQGRPLRLVHRDVSPQNVLIGFDGVVRVTDFGIAKALGQQTATTVGVLRGKYGYMSPEQFRFRTLDRRSDLFALGTLSWELLSASRLYADADASHTARRVMEEPPPDLGNVRGDAPDALVQLVFDLLSKDPDHRPQTASEVSQRIARIERELDVESDLGSYLGERFSAERRQRTAWRSQAIRDAEQRHGRLARPWWKRSRFLVPAAAVLVAGTGWLVGMSAAQPEKRGGAMVSGKPVQEGSPEEALSRVEERSLESGENRSSGAGRVTEDRAARSRHRQRRRTVAARRRRRAPIPPAETREPRRSEPTTPAGRSSHDDRLWALP